MKRRNFLKGVALAALSPLAAMQPKEAAAAQATTMVCGHRGLAGSIVEEPEYVAYTIPGVTELPKKNIIGYPIHVGYGCAILDDRRILRLRF